MTSKENVAPPWMAAYLAQQKQMLQEIMQPLQTDIQTVKSDVGAVKADVDVLKSEQKYLAERFEQLELRGAGNDTILVEPDGPATGTAVVPRAYASVVASVLPSTSAPVASRQHNQEEVDTLTLHVCRGKDGDSAGILGLQAEEMRKVGGEPPVGGR